MYPHPPFEAEDFNFFLKLHWGHRLVRRALELDLLHTDQHGSIPRRMAIHPVMLTHQLTTDLCRVLKHDFARFDNDASTCYDRIIVALAMLAARKCGTMPCHAVQVHADALCFMRYTVKTMYGILEENYHGTVFEPLFDGSGASPSTWLTLVVILLQTLDRLVPDRIYFSSPSGSHSRLSDAFLDDTYLGFTIFRVFSRSITNHRSKVGTPSILIWPEVKLEKCSWYILRWEWKQGRLVIRPILPTDRAVQLKTGCSDNMIVIRRSHLDESQRMLGVIMNPMVILEITFKFLKSKVDTFAQRLLSPRLSSRDFRIFHRSAYIPSMRYGLSAVTLDEEILGQVQSKWSNRY